MKYLALVFVLYALLTSGCGDGGTSGAASAYTPPQPAGVSEDQRPPSPPEIE